jgi:transcriptional regulator with XRE-family HTH domain
MGRRDNSQRDKQRAQFGKWLQDGRLKAGYASQKEFASLLKISDVHLSRIETGSSGISSATLDLAINWLKLDPREAYQKAGLLPPSLSIEGATKSEVMRQVLLLRREDRVQLARAVLAFEGIYIGNDTIALPEEVGKEKPPDAEDISRN